ncbi:MAG: hypothetical protein HZA04_02860 [Nitrospinae bacterium]|nr:hypothetical protein [Nitrospinota bacterium]
MIKTVFALAIVMAATVVSAQENPGYLSPRDASEAMRKAEEAAKSLQLPPVNQTGETGQKANEMYDIYNSKEYQEKIKAETERVKKEIFREYLPPEPAVTPAGPKESDPGSTLAAEERIYIFVSSSMPATALRNYAISAARVGNPKNVFMVLRGFVGGLGDFKATGEFAQSFLRIRPSCTGKCEQYPVNLTIDPLAFRKYGITKVPAVVYARGVNPMEGIECVAGQENGGEYWVAYGDAPLRELLEYINGEAHSEALARILAEDL